MKLRLLSVLILLLTLFRALHATPQFRDGTSIGASVICAVSSDTGDQLKYTYTVQVSPASPEMLAEFSIELAQHGRAADTLVTIDSVLEVNWGGFLGYPIAIPANFAGAEITWVPLDTIVDLADQFKPPRSAIHQGDSLVVAISSPGLPSLTRCWLRGWYVPIDQVEYDSLRNLGYRGNEIVKPWYFDARESFTIAPNITNVHSSPGTLLDTLASQMLRCQTLHWLTKQGIVERYIKILNAAKERYSQHQSGVAVERLDELLSKLKADDTNILAPQVFSLVRFNVEHIRRLITASKTR